MTNRNTEDIDKLFREGLNPDEGLLTVSEGEWPKLEQRLVRHEQKKRGIVWLTRLGGIAALMLLFFALRLFLSDETGQVVQKPRVQQHAPGQDAKQAQGPQKELGTTKQQDPTTGTSPANKTGSKAVKDSGTGLAQNKQREETSGDYRTTIAGQEKETINRDTLQIADLKVHEAAPEPADRLPVTDAKANDSLPPDSIRSAGQSSTGSDEPLLAALEEPVKQPTIEPIHRKLTLSVLAAPGYNGVDNLRNASLGSDFGLLISYAFAQNWSFSTGGIYAKKLYETGYSNYTPAEDIWSEYHPRSVYADCRVLDIPLNVSYTFLKGKNSSFSAGSGISSYIMLKEDYRFMYAETDPDTPLNYQVVNGSQHWLSVVNLQATFEQRLSSRLSVSLQPYMKVPLSAVGFAGVKLHTLGMAANLNWNFNL